MKYALVVTVLILAFNSLLAQQLTVQVFDSIRNVPLSNATDLTFLVKLDW